MHWSNSQRNKFVGVSLDDEHEQDMNQEDLSVSWSQQNQTGSEERKPIVGMKRAMESYVHV